MEKNLPENKKEDFDSLKIICNNCLDFDLNNNVCTIRYLIHKNNTKSPLPRKASQKGCKVFLRKYL